MPVTDDDLVRGLREEVLRLRLGLGGRRVGEMVAALEADALDALGPPPLS